MQMHIVSASLALLRAQQMTTPAGRDGCTDLVDISGSQGPSAQPYSRSMTCPFDHNHRNSDREHGILALLK
jgi:hypothetical protein